jgi:hypothetical protein
MRQRLFLSRVADARAVLFAVFASASAACGASIVTPEDREAADARPFGDGSAGAPDAAPPSEPVDPSGTATGGSGASPDPTSTRLTCHDIDARVGQRTALHADGPPRVAYQWSIVTAPQASVAQIALPDQPSPTFVPDIIGEWLFEVAVFDGQRLIDVCRTRLVARA